MRPLAYLFLEERRLEAALARAIEQRNRDLRRRLDHELAVFRRAIRSAGRKVARQ